MKLGLLLLALGYGYRVYADASKEKGNLRLLGVWVGLIIMATSFAASAYMVSRYSCGITGKGVCPFRKMKNQEQHFTLELKPTAAPQVKK